MLARYSILSLIGLGSTSRVFLARADGKLFAAKRINKVYDEQNNMLNQNIAQNEVRILQLLKDQPGSLQL